MQKYELPSRVYQQLLASTPTPIIVHDTHGQVVAANQAFADLLGYTLEEARTLTAQQVIHADDMPRRDADAERLLDGRTPRLTGERRLLLKNGGHIHARVRKATASLDGEPIVLAIIEDHSDDLAVKAELIHVANTDELTGIANRRGAWAHIDDLPDEAYPQVLAIVDVDRLKRINDEAGHAAGDEVLATAARRLTDAVGPDAFAARLSGDEFIVLAGRAATDADSLVAAIRQGLDGPVDVGGTSTELSVSIGTATLHHPEGLRNALSGADAAMYRDKGRRRR